MHNNHVNKNYFNKKHLTTFYCIYIKKIAIHKKIYSALKYIK